MPTERFQFTGSEGHQLAAALDLPEGEPMAYALFAHCFTCGKDVLAAQADRRRRWRRMASRCWRFDFTGLGSSEGDFANATFSSNVADLVRAADHLRETREAPAILIGHSLGGAAILAAARPKFRKRQGRRHHRRALRSLHVTGLFKESIEEIPHGKSEVSLAGQPFRISREFLEDIAEHSLMRHVAGLHKALLVMHAPSDDTVGYFVDKGLRKIAAGEEYKVASDQLGCATHTVDAGRKIMEVTESGPCGLYHLANQGQCTRFELARMAVELAGLDPAKVIGVPDALMQRRAPRLKYSVLDMVALRRGGFALPRPWQEALTDYVNSVSR